MGDIIKFTKTKKALERTAAEKKATENRVAFGRTKAEKTLAKAREDKANTKLDALKLSPTDQSDKPT